MYFRWLIVSVVFLCFSASHADGEVVCSVGKKNGDGLVTVNDYALFNCSRTGEQANVSDVKWYRVDSGEEMTEISDNGVVTWLVSGLDNGVEFRCSSHYLANVEESTCSVIPLAIPPDVSLEYLGGNFVLGEGASFTCNAKGLPEIASYGWYIDGVDNDALGSRFTYQNNGRTATIRKLMKSDNGTVVTCEAYVRSGLTANASLPIDLEFPPADRGSMVNLWIFIACAAAGGVPVFVLMVVCLAWCVRKSRARGSRTKKRSQSRRHIVLNEEQNEPREAPQQTTAETTLNEYRLENGLGGASRSAPDEEDDGTNPPRHKPAPPPVLDPDSMAVYVNTPAPSSAATLPNLGHRPTSPVHYNVPKPTHQRKKTEYENVPRDHEDQHSDHHEDPWGESSAPKSDVYENVAPRPLSPKPKLGHTASLPNFPQV